MSKRPPEEPARVAVHELDPELRDHLLALDQPVSQPDWSDVRLRAAKAHPHRARRVALAGTILCVAAVGAASAMGARITHIVDFWSAPAAPPSAASAFTEGALWTRGFPRGLELGKTRRIAVDPFRGESMRLLVAPLAHGGFCYAWALKPGVLGTWVDELGGCSQRAEPLSLGYDDTRVSIVADRARANGVAVELSNGRVVKPSLRWVSAPVNAGFLLYQPPNGLHVAGVTALLNGDPVEQYPIGQAKLVLHVR
ncbi:MAG TPA: hypothetical protein VFA43_20985 [Gemmatimonadaceae bacterium]|nr:hypothetical protein [Gemmatimonadaceae bacterium]